MGQKVQVYVDVVSVMHHHAVEDISIKLVVIRKPCGYFVHGCKYLFQHLVFLVCRLALLNHALYHALVVGDLPVALLPLLPARRSS